MSIELALAWAARTLRFPQAVQDAARMFEQAARDGGRATLLVSDRLTKDRKGWLARWTGSEVVVVELSPRHQVGLGLRPGMMCRHVEGDADSAVRPLIQRLTLSHVEIDDRQALAADRPIVGTCRIGFEASADETPEKCALRAEYFQPEVRGQVTGYWHLDDAIRSGRVEHRFTLPPLVTEHRASRAMSIVSGSLVLLLQLVTADDWRKLIGLRPVSNTIATVVEIQA